MLEIKAEEVNTSSPALAGDSIYYPIIFDTKGETFSIVNNGTAAAPCRLTLIPKFDAMKVSIEGLTDEKVSLKPIQRDQIVVIDGINRTITLDGIENFDIYDGWEFPKIQPGENIIKITQAQNMKVEIQYQPRYI